MSHGATHYEILKVRHDATPGQIRSAYKNLCRIYHPDMTGSIVVGEVTATSAGRDAENKRAAGEF